MEAQRTGAVEDATRLVEESRKKGVVLRLLGGVAFYLRCPSVRSGSLARSYSDIDLVGHRRQSSEIRKVFDGVGYAPDERFNALHGERRLIFRRDGGRADVFLDVFEMCHRIDLERRMEVDPVTIPLADLLATKLQIIETNEKDIGDMISLLLDYDVGGTDLGVVNMQYLARLCGKDWGLYKTFSMKLATLRVAVEGWMLSSEEKETVTERIDALNAAMEGVPRSLGWRLRAVIGERVRWYELPEQETGSLERAPP